jgi:cytidine deaminase
MDAAREASTRAYAPYSNLHVGAAILTEGGAIHAGSNIENVSYGLTICAERNAAAAMAFANPSDREIKLIAVFSPDVSPCLPCGACRQVLHEFGCKDVVVEDESGLRRYPFGEILPHPFGAQNPR